MKTVFLNLSLGILRYDACLHSELAQGCFKVKPNLKFAALKFAAFVCVCVCVLIQKVTKPGSMAVLGWMRLRGWKLKGKTVRRERDATSPPAFQQLAQPSWRTFPSDPLLISFLKRPYLFFSAFACLPVDEIVFLTSSLKQSGGQFVTCWLRISSGKCWGDYCAWWLRRSPANGWIFLGQGMFSDSLWYIRRMSVLLLWFNLKRQFFLQECHHFPILHLLSVREYEMF